jgi:hypothetical protein
LVLYLALLHKFAPSARVAPLLRVSLIFFIFLTLSRSAVLGLLVYWLASGTFRRVLKRKIAAVAGVVVLMSCTFWFYFEDQWREYIAAAQIAEIVEARVTMEEGSSGSTHLLLIQRGIEVWSSTPERMLTGIGLGAAYRVLGDIFGSEKHENFHCMYITWLAECGLPALMTVSFILLYPLVRRIGSSVFILPILVFNIPYQIHLEPMLWFAIAYCWSLKRRTLSLPVEVSRDNECPA